MITKCSSQLLAIDSNLPGQNSRTLQLGPGEFRDGGLVITRQGIKRKFPVAVEIEEVIAALRLIVFLKPVQRFRDVTRKPVAISLKIYADFRGERIHRFIGNEALRVRAPCARRRGENENGNGGNGDAGRQAARNETLTLAHQLSATPFNNPVQTITPISNPDQ